MGFERIRRLPAWSAIAGFSSSSSADAMSLLGNKVAAKNLAKKARSLVPGSNGGSK